MKKVKSFIKKSAFKKTWIHHHDGHDIKVTNWWSLFGMNGDFFQLNNKPLKENFFWFVSPNTVYTFPLNENETCKVVIASKWHGVVGCHIFINDELVGGDVKDELIWDT